MTDHPALSPRDDDDALAAEFVLGVLDLASRSAAEARLKHDTGFAAQVAAWENRLSGLNDDYAEVAAPDLLPRIEARLFPVAAKPQRNWLGWFGGAAIAAALTFAVILVQRPVAPDLVATLQGEGQPLIIAASYGDGTLNITRAGGPEAEAGRVYELWLIAGENAPVSLGLIEGESTTRQLDTLPKGATLAISLEPDGGSTTGQPTGPVLVTGVITEI
jgi:anti-sigma-K factor RskA